MARTFGSPNWINLGSRMPSQGVSTFSAFAWIYSTSITAYQTIYVDDVRGLWISPTGRITWFDLGTTTGFTTLSANTWYHVGIVSSVAANNTTLYLNGVSDNSSTGVISLPGAGANAGIGGHNQEYFSGKIEDVAVWNVALSANEILALVKGKRPRQIRPRPVGYWPLFGTHATNEPDMSGNRGYGLMSSTPVGSSGGPLTLWTPKVRTPPDLTVTVVTPPPPTNQEFYCDFAIGNNLFSGDTASSTADCTALAGTYTRAGGAAGTDRLAAASGTPFSAAAVDRYAAVKSASGTGIADFVAAITAVNAGGASLDLSLTKIAGTRPASAASVDCRVGGSWKGPNTAVSFPFGLATLANLTNSTGQPPRVNLKAGTTYAITAGMTHAPNGPTVFQGYTTTPGDGGRWVLDAGTSTITMLALSGSNLTMRDFEFRNNGTSGVSVALNSTGAENLLIRGVIHDIRGSGFSVSSSGTVLVECEAYNCNLSNGSGSAGFLITGACLIRCIAHDNTGSNNAGFRSAISGQVFFDNCLADSNGSHGFHINQNAMAVFRQCDTYNNGGDGVNYTASGTASVILENCNLVKNTGWGVNLITTACNVFMANCGFGSGTQANTSGTTSFVTGTAVVVEGSVTYASGVTPWVDPANGDFRITLAAAKGAGRGSYLQTAASYSGTVGYPDIGSSQHLDSGGGGGGGGGGPVLGCGFIQGLGRVA